MNESLPHGFIFMKVGNHAGEDFDQIMERKMREIETAGQSFWGYGGNTLHPRTQVQPFARLCLQQQGSIELIMEPIDSKADPELLPAREYSADGQIWKPIPNGIDVTGSKYALVLTEIRPGDLAFSVNDYAVGIGPSQGKSAGDYLRGRVDKGCFVRRDDSPFEESFEGTVKQIGFVAKMEEPYAVFLK